MREAKFGSELKGVCGTNKRAGDGAEKSANKLLLLVINIPINDLPFTVRMCRWTQKLSEIFY